jgi:hypothetical protein
MALDAMCGTVPPKMVSTITKKETVKEAWDTFTTMKVGNDSSRIEGNDAIVVSEIRHHHV